jgi:hypothetical protein
VSADSQTASRAAGSFSYQRAARSNAGIFTYKHAIRAGAPKIGAFKFSSDRCSPSRDHRPSQHGRVPLRGRDPSPMHCYAPAGRFLHAERHSETAGVGSLNRLANQARYVKAALKRRSLDAEVHRLPSVASPAISADEFPGIGATPCAFSTLGKCLAKTDQRGGREPRRKESVH